MNLQVDDVRVAEKDTFTGPAASVMTLDAYLKNKTKSTLVNITVLENRS